VENFCSHAHSVHDAKMPLTMTKEDIDKRYGQLGGVLYGEMDEQGRFRPNVT